MRLAVFAICLVCAGCAHVPEAEVPRPEQVLDFPALYKQNCAGCHGENGRNGAAISLANPAYLAFAGRASVRQAIAAGVAGKLMPPFATSSGGSLTDAQVDSLADGIFKSWSNPQSAPSPPYSSASKGDSTQGQKTFAASCARCHQPGAKGSIVDPNYLALVSDQSLRSTIVAGHPDPIPALSDQQLADVVAWLAAQRRTL